jgi:hypothetical protein
VGLQGLKFPVPNSDCHGENKKTFKFTEADLMSASSWFDDVPVLGKLPPEQATAKLREAGEEDAAAVLEAGQQGTTRTFGMPFQDRPWQHTAHAFGYLASAPPGSAPLSIQHAGNIAADPALKNSHIKITLDRLRVAAYPGGGMHRVLFDFYAQNQVPGEVEHLHFNVTCRVHEGEQAAMLGYPIFVGLNVGSEGVAFKCFKISRDLSGRPLRCARERGRLHRQPTRHANRWCP